MAGAIFPLINDLHFNDEGERQKMSNFENIDMNMKKINNMSKPIANTTIRTNAPSPRKKEYTGKTYTGIDVYKAAAELFSQTSIPKYAKLYVEVAKAVLQDEEES